MVVSVRIGVGEHGCDPSVLVRYRGLGKLTAETVQPDRGVAFTLQRLGNLDRLLESFLRVGAVIGTSFQYNTRTTVTTTHVVPKNSCNFSFCSSVFGGN
jgi:uncharacterized protein RhaS with RHS repeats